MTATSGNPRLSVVYDDCYLEHDTGYHAECPDRLRAINRGLDGSGLRPRLHPLQPRPADPDELALVHTPRHIKEVARLCAGGGGYLDPDTVACPRSYEVARLAAGGLLTALDDMWSDSGRCRSLCLVRPPGHHALAGQAMGFCLFNNVAVAAAYARHCGLAERVLVVDWDLHHGNGTEAIFYDDPRVLYFSVHQWPAYPGTGQVEDIGEGPGEGFTINVPLAGGAGDADYDHVFAQVLEPCARRFRPHLIIVSAGMDAHAADPLGGMRLSTAAFAALAARVAALADELCQGRVLVALEGGYSLEALASSIVAIVEQLDGSTSASATVDDLPIAGPVGSKTRQRVEEVRAAHPRWFCLEPPRSGGE